MSTYAPSNQSVLLRSIEPGQITSWAFTRRALDSGLVPSMGSKGDCYDKTLVSHCTSWCRFDQSSLGEAAAHAFDEPGVAGGGRLEEPFVLVVGLVGDEQAGAAPGLDGGAVNAETVGDLVHGEQATLAEAVGVAGELVGVA